MFRGHVCWIYGNFVSLLYKSDEFHHPQGIDNTLLQERSIVRIRETVVAKKELFGDIFFDGCFYLHIVTCFYLGLKGLNNLNLTAAEFHAAVNQGIVWQAGQHSKGHIFATAYPIAPAYVTEFDYQEGLGVRHLTANR